MDEWVGLDKSDIESCRKTALAETFRFKPQSEWVGDEYLDWWEDPWPCSMHSGLFRWFEKRHSRAKTPEEKQAVIDDFVETRTLQLHSDRFDYIGARKRVDIDIIGRALDPAELEKALRGRFLQEEMPDWVKDKFPELEAGVNPDEAARWIGGWYLRYSVWHPDPDDLKGEIAQTLGDWLTEGAFFGRENGYYDFSEIDKDDFE